MKKLVLVMIMAVAAIAVNAQRTTIKAGDLPKGVSEYLTKDYPGYIIRDANKESVNKMITYEVTAVKGSSQEMLVFSSDGKFLKKENAKMGMAEKRSSNAYSGKTTRSTGTGTKK